MTHEWRVIATYPMREAPGDEEASVLVQALPGFGILRHDADAGRLEVQATVQAPTIRTAAEAGVRAMRQACAGAFGRQVDPLVLRVLALEEYEREVAAPAMQDLVGYREIAEMLGVSAQRAGQLAGRPDFPGPVGRTSAGPVFTRGSVAAFERGWDRKPGRPRKTS